MPSGAVTISAIHRKGSGCHQARWVRQDPIGQAPEGEELFPRTLKHRRVTAHAPCHRLSGKKLRKTWRWLVGTAVAMNSLGKSITERASDVATQDDEVRSSPASRSCLSGARRPTPTRSGRATVPTLRSGAISRWRLRAVRRGRRWNRAAEGFGPRQRGVPVHLHGGRPRPARRLRRPGVSSWPRPTAPLPSTCATGRGRQGSLNLAWRLPDHLRGGRRRGARDLCHGDRWRRPARARTIASPTRVRPGSVRPSPDGTRITYWEGEDDPTMKSMYRVHIVDADGTYNCILLPKPAGARFQDAQGWSNDGTRLAVVRGYGVGTRTGPSPSSPPTDRAPASRVPTGSPAAATRSW